MGAEQTMARVCGDKGGFPSMGRERRRGFLLWFNGEVRGASVLHLVEGGRRRNACSDKSGISPPGSSDLNMPGSLSECRGAREPDKGANSNSSSSTSSHLVLRDSRWPYTGSHHGYWTLNAVF